jgi:hypothetical protein
MPNLFVVTDQKNLTALTKALLTARVSVAARDRAAEAIRRANPALDLDQLQPGAVVVIPDVTGLRASVDDPVGEAGDEVVESLRAGLESLVAATKLAEERRQEEKKEAQGLFGSAAVKRLSAVVPELEENVAAARVASKQDDVDARQQLAALGEATDRWAADLAELRNLL